MTSSGTYNFNPSIGEITLYAFNLCGIRPTALTADHMFSAKTALNMMLSRWSNLGVNLWKVDLVETNLVEGQSTYSVQPRTVMILDAYVSTEQSGAVTDRIITPISRSEWASYPNKEQQGFPTVFWFDRLISPTVTIWPVPTAPGNGNPTKLKYYRVTQIEDANLTNGETADIPYRWLDALANGLAFHLARIWAPQMAEMLKSEAGEAYQIAATQDTENVPIYISPMIGGYFR